MKTRGTGPAGETIDTPRHRALGSASRVAILQLIRAADAGLTTGDVAARTGLHFSTVRAHLERLVEAGLLIKARASDGGPGRPAWRYRAAVAPEPAPAPYRTLAAALLEHLATSGGGAPAAARAGLVWGRKLAAAVPDPASPVDATVAVLKALGFDPYVPRAGGVQTAAADTDMSGPDTSGGDGEASAPEPEDAGDAANARNVTVGHAENAGNVTLSTVTPSTVTPSNVTPSNTAGNNVAGNNVAGNNVAGNNVAGNNAAGKNVEVHLRTCPFLELVGQHPDVMCALHAGVIRGVLRNAGAPDGEAVLEPFAAPNACVARLRLPTGHSGQP